MYNRKEDEANVYTSYVHCVHCATDRDDISVVLTLRNAF